MNFCHPSQHYRADAQPPFLNLALCFSEDATGGLKRNHGVLAPKAPRLLHLQTADSNVSYGWTRELTTIMAVCLSACQVLTDARRRPRVVQLHRVERWGHYIDKSVQCIVVSRKWFPRVCKASPPGPPREPAGTSSSAEALPHGLAHASGPLPRAIDTWPPEMAPLLIQFHPAAPNSIKWWVGSQPCLMDHDGQRTSQESSVAKQQDC